MSRSNLLSADLQDVVEEVAELPGFEGVNEPVEHIQGFGTGLKSGVSSGAGPSTSCVDHSIVCE